MDRKLVKVAVVGNPNTGKTSIFNLLTGSHYKVANWPGVTIEKKEGKVLKGEFEFIFVDLPGTYSLSPLSVEEEITLGYLLRESPDIVLDIVDSTNLERNLFLTTQLMELNLNLIIVFNLIDEAKKKGIQIDFKNFSQLVGLQVVATSAKLEEGIDELWKAILDVASRLNEKYSKIGTKRRVIYNKEIEELIEKVQGLMGGESSLFIVLQLLLLERERQANLLELLGVKSEVKEELYRLIESKKHEFRGELVTIITNSRYGFIRGILKETVKEAQNHEEDFSQKLDKIVMNRFLGIPIFAFILWVIFTLSFKATEPLVNLIDSSVLFLSSSLSEAIKESSFLRGLLCDGIIAGVGSVIVFVPTIAVLYFLLGLLEDTGYMARIAFLTDKIMHTVGLHGKSFIPMILGFGCNVPAIMATRILQSQRDRIITMLMITFIPCSARFTVFVLIIGTFFSSHQGTLLFLVYLIGILIAFSSAIILGKTVYKGKESPFVMELPPYRLPTFKSILVSVGLRVTLFLKKIATVILVASVIIWFLSFMPGYGKKEITETYLGRIGKAVSPIFAPIGMDWKDTIAILSGITAKEIIVATYGVLYHVEEKGEDSLKVFLRAHPGGISFGISLLLFVLLYFPCIGTYMVLIQETGSIKWALVSGIFSFILAWSVSFLGFNLAKLIT